MTRKSRSSGGAIPVNNGLLSALLRTEYRRLVAKMEHVELARGTVLHRAGQDIEYVYFPKDAVVAMVNTTQDDRTVEVGVIGREGMTGINIFLGGLATPDQAIVQLSGGAPTPIRTIAGCRMRPSPRCWERGARESRMPPRACAAGCRVCYRPDRTAGSFRAID